MPLVAHGRQSKRMPLLAMKEVHSLRKGLSADLAVGRSVGKRLCQLLDLL